MGTTPDRTGRPQFRGIDVPPVILPAKGAGGQGARRRWLAVMGALVVAGALAVSIASRGGPDASAGRPLFESPGVPVRPSGEAALTGAIDSLRSSLAQYRQRQTDFERGRIECAALAAGYDRVGREVVDVARRRRAVRDPRADTISAYESVMEEAAAVDRRFDETGCPRP